MVYRIYVEKKPGFDGEAQSLRNELVSLLGIKELSGLRLLNRYDVEGIDEALFEQCVPTVFSEPPVYKVKANNRINRIWQATMPRSLKSSMRCSTNV